MSAAPLESTPDLYYGIMNFFIGSRQDIIKLDKAYVVNEDGNTENQKVSVKFVSSFDGGRIRGDIVHDKPPEQE